MSAVRIIEVGPRDGLQNEKTPIPTEVKRNFVQSLADAGLREIEATSFVSPKAVPQLGDASDLWPLLPPGPIYSALVPNLKGLERALDSGVSRIAVFTAASDAFTLRNVNMTVEETLSTFREVIGRFREGVPGGFVRGYVSTAFECPYSGKVSVGKVVEVSNELIELGVDEISIGDTIGVAVPAEVRALAKALVDDFAARLDQIAWHFHDTRGTGVANVAEALDWGCFGAFDASAGGLGGCPFAPGAGGNLATEDLVYFLERSGVPSGVRPELLARASLEVLEILGRAPSAKAQLPLLAAGRSCPR